MRLRKLFIVLNIILISMIGLIRTSFIADAVTFSIVPIALCAIILLFCKDYSLFPDKKNIKYDIVFTVLFILMLSLEEVLKVMRSMDGEFFNAVFKLIYFPVLIYCLMIDIDYVLYVSHTVSTDDYVSLPGSGKFLGIYHPVWMYIAVSFLFLIAYYPGVMHTDFEKEWMWGYDTKWSDWHTVGYLMFIKLCTILTDRPFMITIGSSLMYYLTANYTVGVLGKHFPSRKYIGWIYMCLYICFGFYSCMYIGEVQKNNLSTPMMIAFSVSLLDYTLSREHNRKHYINMAVFAFLASLFRHSLWEIVLITIVFTAFGMFFYKGKTKEEKKKDIKGLALIFATTIASFLIFTEGLAFGILKAERNPAYIKYTVPMNLAASMAYRSRETGLLIDDDIKQKMEQIIPMEKWAEYYCPYDADVIDRPWHEIGDNVLKLNDPKIAADIIRVNWYYLTHYPRQFVLSFFDINSIVWEIAKAPELEMYSPHSAPEHYDIHHMRKGEFYNFSESLKMFLGSFGIGRTVVYRGGLYLYLMILIAFILLRKHQFQVLTSMLPILLYALALMISIPQEGSQYIMPFPLFTALFGVVSFAIRENGQAPGDTEVKTCRD